MQEEQLRFREKLNSSVSKLSPNIDSQQVCSLPSWKWIHFHSNTFKYLILIPRNCTTSCFSLNLLLLFGQQLSRGWLCPASYLFSRPFSDCHSPDPLPWAYVGRKCETKERDFYDMETRNRLKNENKVKHGQINCKTIKGHKQSWDCTCDDDRVWRRKVVKWDFSL